MSAATILRAIPRKPLPRVLEERVTFVNKQAQRVLDRKREKARRLDLKSTFRSQVEHNRAFKKRRMKSRAEEMEDRWLGPLAPNRAVNEIEKQLRNAVSQDEQAPPPVPKHERIKYWNIVPKDRVVILTGPDKHKIGVVKKINKENNTLTVEGLNMFSVEMPSFLREVQEQPKDQPPVYTWMAEMPLPLDAVRLVYPLSDPVTGLLTDTIIAELETVSIYHDRETGNRGWKRAIKGDGTVIPWPKGEKKVREEFDDDTRSFDVDRKSFRPTLIKEPFPSVIIDELRNKYSKFRTRHDPEFIEQKIAEEKLKEGLPIIRTPLQELNRKIRLEKKALGPPTLSEDVLERIGRTMAQNKPKLLEAILSEQQQSTQPPQQPQEPEKQEPPQEPKLQEQK